MSGEKLLCSRMSAPRPKANIYVLFAGAGLQFFAAVGGMAALGFWLDGCFRTTPWLAVTGVLLGSCGGFWNLWRIVQMANEE